MGRLYGFIIISLAPTIAAKMPRYAFCLEKMGKKALSYYTFTTAPRCEWEHQQPNFVRGKQANLVPLVEPFIKTNEYCTPFSGDIKKFHKIKTIQPD